MRSMTLATIIAGISGFAVIIVAARAFGDDTQSALDFTAYWGFFFACTGILTGLTQETTRAVAQEDAPADAASPWKVAAVIALLVILLIAGSSPLWIHGLVSTPAFGPAVLLALGLGSYTMQASMAGMLSGARLWKHLAALISLDTGSRMVLAVVAWLMGWKLFAFLIITVFGALSWLLFLFSARIRQALAARSDVNLARFLRRCVTAMAASGATAILITGFPTIVRFTHTADPVAVVSAPAVIYAVTLTRAPLLLPLQQFQSALIVRFVSNPRWQALLSPLGLVAGVGVLGAAAAWAIGPWLMVTLLGPHYQVPGLFMALYTLGATCTAALMVSGAAALALEHHSWYLAGWVAATTTAIGVFLSPLPLAHAAWVALVLGPLLGLLVHAYAMTRPASV